MLIGYFRRLAVRCCWHFHIRRYHHVEHSVYHGAGDTDEVPLYLYYHPGNRKWALGPEPGSTHVVGVCDQDSDGTATLTF